MLWKKEKSKEKEKKCKINEINKYIENGKKFIKISNLNFYYNYEL